MDRFRARSLSGRTYLHLLWDYFRQHRQKNSGLRIDHLLLNAPNWRHDSAVPASIAGSATGPAQATTRRPGSSWISGAKKEGAKRQRGTLKQSNTPSKITLWSR
jgi:exodeoxyribonuclease-3